MKVGIITLYYNSINYGGVLQAYALCRYLQKNGVEAEQIAYQYDRDESLVERIRRFFNQGFVMAIKKVFYVINARLKFIPINDKELKNRKEAFDKFVYEIIPHSKKVFTQHTIRECENLYDIFITGSDQVWNFAWYESAYFLDFVNGIHKKKVSYAASFSMKKLTYWQKKIVSKRLKDFTAISVREYDAKNMLNGLVNKTVSCVVDPTLLLDFKEWDSICEHRIINEPYVFGYFIGSNINVVRLAEEYAKERNIKFVMIPFASGHYNMEEAGIANIRVIDASPEKFLSLIKYAEYVFTDSFHAVVFSYIFKKQFYVFNRDAKGSMNSRITSLTEMFDLQERFCTSKEQETLRYIKSLSNIDYTVEFPKFEECREKSYEFIKINILKESNNELVKR